MGSSFFWNTDQYFIPSFLYTLSPSSVLLIIASTQGSLFIDAVETHQLYNIFYPRALTNMHTKRDSQYL